MKILENQKITNKKLNRRVGKIKLTEFPRIQKSNDIKNGKIHENQRIRKCNNQITKSSERENERTQVGEEIIQENFPEIKGIRCKTETTHHMPKIIWEQTDLERDLL